MFYEKFLFNDYEMTIAYGTNLLSRMTFVCGWGFHGTKNGHVTAND